MNSGSDAHDFAGFDVPQQNWFKMPRAWTNITAEITSLAELKVVQYVLTHTWGYQEYGIAKLITTDEFINGRKRRDGSRMDKGTGLSNRSVIDGIRRAIKNGYLVEIVDDSDRGRIKKYYKLKMRSQESQAEAYSSDVKNVHIAPETDVNILHSVYEEPSHRTEKDTFVRTNGRERTVRADVIDQWGIGETELSIWPQALATLKRSMTKATFETWLIDSLLLQIDGATATIGVRNSQAQDWCTHRLGDTIAHTLGDLLELSEISLSFVPLNATVSEH